MCNDTHVSFYKTLLLPEDQHPTMASLYIDGNSQGKVESPCILEVYY